MIVARCVCGKMFVRHGTRETDRWHAKLHGCGAENKCYSVEVFVGPDPHFCDLVFVASRSKPSRIESLDLTRGRVIATVKGYPGMVLDIQETFEARTGPLEGWRDWQTRPWSNWLAGLQKAAG